MTDPTRPRDELVSAVLDGEADAADQAAVQADPELRARLEEFASVRRAVAAAVPPTGDRFRERAIAAALAAADPSDVGAADEPVVDLAGVRSRRALRARRVLVAGAAVVAVLALAGGLSRLGNGGDDASTQAADAPAEATAGADRAGAATATDLALGAIDDPATLADRLAAATGLGGAAADGVGGDGFDTDGAAPGEPEAAAPGDDATESDLAAPRTADGEDDATATGRSSEDCTIDLIEDRPQLTGQLAHGTVTYQGVDAYVFVYHDPASGGVLAVVMRSSDCTVLADVPF